MKKTIKRGYLPTYSLLPVILFAILSTIVLQGQNQALSQELEPSRAILRFERKVVPQPQLKATEARITCYLPTGNPMANGLYPKEGDEQET